MPNLSVRIKKNNKKMMTVDIWCSKIMRQEETLKDVVELW